MPPGAGQLQMLNDSAPCSFMSSGPSAAAVLMGMSSGRQAGCCPCVFVRCSLTAAAAREGSMHTGQVVIACAAWIGAQTGKLTSMAYAGSAKRKRKL